MEPTLAHFRFNPAYASGACRRRLQFALSAQRPPAQAHDMHHAYCLTLSHHGGRVTSVEAGCMRARTTACPGAVAGLRPLVGLPFGGSVGKTLGRPPAHSNSMPLADATVWSMAQSDRDAVWDIVIPDRPNRPGGIDILRNDRALHHWQIRDGHILSPSALAGLRLRKGCARRARATFAGILAISATMLRRGLFGARGRRYIVDKEKSVSLTHANGVAGMCWSYSGDRVSSATGTPDYVSDFSTARVTKLAPPHINARLQGRTS